MRLDRLGDRDGWTCWLCGNAVDPHAPAGSAHAASVDHVVPRAHGGETTDDNLRLAHRKCNTRRGSKIPELTWPGFVSLIDSAPLWQAVKRLAAKPGTTEQVAFFSDAQEADQASSWVVTVATTMTGQPWTADVVDLSGSHGVRLSAGR